MVNKFTNLSNMYVHLIHSVHGTQKGQRVQLESQLRFKPSTSQTC